MFPSSVIIAGGKQRRDVNAMDTTDPSPHHIQLWPHVRASAAFSEARSQVSRQFDILTSLRALSPEAPSENAAEALMCGHN